MRAVAIGCKPGSDPGQVIPGQCYQSARQESEDTHYDAAAPSNRPGSRSSPEVLSKDPFVSGWT